MKEYERIVCNYGLEECPYKKSHCCLCEIKVESIKEAISVKIKHKCKVKGSLMVTGTIAYGGS